MNVRRRSDRTRRVLLALIALNVAAAKAIEAPTTAEPPPAAAPAAPGQVSVTPSDEGAFYERLQFVTHKRMLTGLGIGDEALRALAVGNVQGAIAGLNSQSVAGDRNATIALIRIQHWCSRIGSAKPTDAQPRLNQLAPTLPPERLARAAGVFVAERAYLPKAQQGCATAPFDYRGIESRLRAAAEAGDPASATELAQFVRDPAKREALLQQAADKNYAPAQYALATARVIAVQRAESTENVASIRLLLKQAGRTMSKAKVDLANCMALGCDGHPADAASAAAFGTDAARDGEPMAFLSMMRMPWGRRYTLPQLLAWQYFGDRLNESGCTGDAYVQTAANFTQTLSMLEKGKKPDVIEQAKAQAETLWQQNAERAKREQGCS